MAEIGMYIYGIINSNKEEGFGPCGITAYEEVYPVRDITEAAKDSKISNGVYTIPYRDISAVVSDSLFVNYTTLPKDQVARYLLTHQQVIEKIMDSYTIIPMRLGTYAFNIKEVEEILLKGYAVFKDVFKKINNKIEIDVVATWSDLSLIINDIGEREEVKELKENLMSKPGGVSVEDQIKIGSLIKNILDKEKEKLAMEIEPALRKCSIYSRWYDLMDDRMIFNVAFLIEKDKKAEFEKRLDELDEQYYKKINFRCVGPLPTYSFYTAEVKKISFEEIKWAKEKLGLDNMAAKEEIVKAYRSRANLCHPDKNSDIPDAERQFDETNRAYRILLEYCQGDACSFNEKGFSQNAIIVKVRE
jgi:hypothetical protein